MVLERLEVPLFGRIWLEALVLAILLDAVTRTLCPLGKRWFVGINFSAKTPLEVAVLLLGSFISAQTVATDHLRRPVDSSSRRAGLPCLGLALAVARMHPICCGADFGAVQHEQAMMTGATDVPFLSDSRTEASPPGQSSPFIVSIRFLSGLTCGVLSRVGISLRRPILPPPQQSESER
jgi:hypothetical protein